MEEGAGSEAGMVWGWSDDRVSNSQTGYENYMLVTSKYIHGKSSLINL